MNIVEDIKILTQAVKSIKFKYFRRSVSKLADMLGKKAQTCCTPICFYNEFIFSKKENERISSLKCEVCKYLILNY